MQNNAFNAPAQQDNNAHGFQEDANVSPRQREQPVQLANREYQDQRVAQRAFLLPGADGPKVDGHEEGYDFTESETEEGPVNTAAVGKQTHGN